MRFWSWFCVIVGAACMLAAVGLGVQAIRQAAESSAYDSARACPAGAAPDASCLQQVHGTVTGVTEMPAEGRVSANYSMDVRTASTTLQLAFSSDSKMLGYAVDGSPASVTMWRGVPVKVETDGRSQVTTSVPETAFARDLGSSEETGGFGALFFLGGLAIRRNRRLGNAQVLAKPVVQGALTLLLLGGAVVLVGGFALGGRPSRIGPDLTATGAALVVAIGLSVWLGLKAGRTIDPSLRNDVHNVRAPVVHAPFRPAGPVMPPPRTPLRIRLHPARLARVLGPIAAAWLTPTLTVGVLFGLFLTGHDGPTARAFRHAPVCVGETNLAACIGDFTAVINGVRTPVNGRSSADVSYVTADGAINEWGTFDGNSGVITRMATADESARTPLTIRVWRGSIIGAELGGTWHWTEGNPPGDRIPAVFLSVSFVLLLLVVRLRIHRRTRSAANNRRLLIDDLGQVLAAAGSVVLLASGFWPGAILAIGALLWLALSARQSTQRSRSTLTAEHAA